MRQIRHTMEALRRSMGSEAALEWLDGEGGCRTSKG